MKLLLPGERNNQIFYPFFVLYGRDYHNHHQENGNQWAIPNQII